MHTLPLRDATSERKKGRKNKEMTENRERKESDN
jgi:hypothetical protein